MPECVEWDEIARSIGSRVDPLSAIWWAGERSTFFPNCPGTKVRFASSIDLLYVHRLGFST